MQMYLNCDFLTAVLGKCLKHQEIPPPAKYRSKSHHVHACLILPMLPALFTNACEHRILSAQSSRHLAVSYLRLKKFIPQMAPVLTAVHSGLQTVSRNFLQRQRSTSWAHCPGQL